MCLLFAWLWEAWPQEGETFTQAQQRFQTQTTEAGLSLFSDFFLVAMGVCMTAALPRGGRGVAETATTRTGRPRASGEKGIETALRESFA